MSGIIYPKAQKYIGSGEARIKYKRNCLKSKTVLYEDQQIQIGCKISPLYDFYTSKYFVQVQIFVGNKTNRTIEGFRINYRATSNLSLFLQQKPRIAKQKSQFKDRLIVACNNFQEEILLLMDYQSDNITLRATPIPLTMLSFMAFTDNIIIPQTISTTNIKSYFSSKYEYTEQQIIEISSSIIKKGISKQITKIFPEIKQLSSHSIYFGQFNTKNLIEQYKIAIEIINENKIKVILTGNQYSVFDSIYETFKFLFSS